MGVRAAVMPGPDQPVELRDLPEPDLEPDSALMRVTLSEVCGTDVYLQQGRLAGVPYPIIPGHVSVGVVEKIRGRMNDIEGRPLAEGDRITFLDVHETCHACWHCLVAKASTRCPKRKVYGITYGVRDGLTGGWAEQLYLKPGVHCIRLDDAADERFMAGGCGLPTSLHAIEQAGITIGDSVLVLGAGPVGLACVALARLSGADKVMCIGAPADRVATASKMGANAVCNLDDLDEDARRDWVLEHTVGRGADITIEATGAPRAVVQAMRWTRDAGRVVVVGQYTDHGETPFNPHLDLNKKHLDVKGCWGSDFSHFYRGVQLMNDPERSAAWEAVRLERFGLDRATYALDAVASGRVIKALIDPAI